MMSTTKIAINTLFFCVFPIRFLILWMPLLDLTYIATFFALVEYVSILVLMFDLFSNHTKSIKLLSIFFFIYWIYSAYLIYYIVISPQLPRDAMLGVPIANSRVFQEIISIGLICPLIAKYHGYVNYIFISKASAVFLYIILILYSLTQNIAVYAFVRDLNDTLLSDYGLVSAFFVGQYAIIAFFFCLWAKDAWSHNKVINNLIIIVAFSFTLFLLLLLNQRGPVLFFFLTILFYYYSKHKTNLKTVLTFLLFMGLVAIFYNDIILIIRSFAPDIIDRFMAIQDDGGSGRFGDDNSLYYLAIQQIKESPLIGSYFRVLSSSVGHYGSYPHNFILELLMTFGLVFTIPFLWLLLIATKNSKTLLYTKHPMGVFGLIFIYIYLSHLTSHSIIFDAQVWCSLALMLSVKKQVIKNGKALL